jgi:FtsH-binding integral membrane protein
MDLPALMPRGFWIRVIVISATLAVFVFAALVMAREHSPAGIVLFAILALFSLARLGATLWRRSPRQLS